jgi:DNA-binding protein YbaB
LTSPGFDYRRVAQQAREMAGQMSTAKDDLMALRAVGTGGSGAVTAVVAGEGYLEELVITPSVVDGGDAAELAEMVREAVNEASRLLAEQRQGRLRHVMGGFQTLVADLRQGNAEEAAER